MEATGSNSGYCNAAVILKATHASSNIRGLGTFMYDTTADNEWFFGRPYATSDRLVMLRDSGNTAHVDSAADPSDPSVDQLYSFAAGDLFMYGSTSTDQFIRLSNTTGSNPYLAISSVLAGNPFVSFQQAGTEKAYIQYIDTGDELRIQTSASSGDITFWPGNSQALTLDTARDMTLSGTNFIFGNTTLQIRSGTSDGSDTKVAYFSGAGGISNSRGSYIASYGNEHASTPGELTLVAGNVAGGEITFYTANTLALTLTTAQNITLAGTDFIRGNNTEYLVLSAGTATNVGANLLLRSGAAAGLAGDFQIRSSSYIVVDWDESIGYFKINTGVGAKTNALTIKNNQDVDFVGDVTAADSRVLLKNNSGNGSITINSSTDTGSPLFDFQQNGTQRAYIQYKDSGDIFRFNCFGEIEFRPNNGNSTLTINYNSGSSLIEIFGSATGSPKISLFQSTNEKAFIQYEDTGDNLLIDSDGSIELSATSGEITLPGLPTSSAGLPTGALWNNSGVVNIV